MPSDPIWWLAVVVQLLALPGSLLPVLPSLLWLPIGAGLWVWHVGWIAGYPSRSVGGLGDGCWIVGEPSSARPTWATRHWRFLFA
ncbi:MAG: hypothetical protein QGH53_06515 [Prochlorococcaceae cyanobacterium ETNP18_MAG_1]|nr:hypothetical protein [Prochlorococcaceae cyanobacterium ETNP18_MAG_1]